MKTRPRLEQLTTKCNILTGSYRRRNEVRTAIRNSLKRFERELFVTEFVPLQIGETHYTKEWSTEMTGWKALENAEDNAHLKAKLMDIPSESFTPEKKKQIPHDMIASSSAIENRMREDFAKLDEVAQTRLLDSFGAPGCRNRDWWHRMLMDSPMHRKFPTI